MRDDDELAAEEDAKSETQVLREAIQLLSSAFLRFQLEASNRIEALEKRAVPIEDYNDD